jgi:hypothetical protein
LGSGGPGREVVAGIVGLLAGICSTDISFDERWQAVPRKVGTIQNSNAPMMAPYGFEGFE